MKPAQPGAIWALRHLISPMAWRLVLASVVYGAAFVVLGGLVGASALLVAEIDMGQAALAISALLIANGALRTGRAYAATRSRRRVEVVTARATALQEALS